MAAVIWLLASCSPHIAYESMNVQSVKVPLAADDYSSVAYGQGNWLVASIRVPGQTYRRLARLHPDGSGKEMLNLPDALTCQRRDYPYLASLPDGTVGYVLECDPYDTTKRVEEYAWAYDPVSNRARQLLQSPFEMGFGQLTWNTTLKRGIFSSYGDPCSEIAWLNVSSAMPFEGVAVGTGSGRWELKHNWETDNGCTGMGLTGAADWSPDGTQIAFFASQAAPKPGESPNMDGRFDLYLMDPSTLKPRSVLAGLVDLGGLRWSPDSRWLVFNASVDGKYGIWLFRPSDGKVLRVTPDDEGGITWSLDGSKIVALSSLPSDSSLGDIVQFDVSSATQ